MTTDQTTKTRLYTFLSDYQDQITTGTAKALARDLGVEVDIDDID